MRGGVDAGRAEAVGEADAVGQGAGIGGCGGRREGRTGVGWWDGARDGGRREWRMRDGVDAAGRADAVGEAPRRGTGCRDRRMRQAEGGADRGRVAAVGLANAVGGRGGRGEADVAGDGSGGRGEAGGVGAAERVEAAGLADGAGRAARRTR